MLVSLSQTARLKFLGCHSSVLIHVFPKTVALSIRRHAGSDDANNIFISFCIDHHRDSTMNLTDFDEAIFFLRLSDVEDL
ncbi:MAG: hypothetical protein RIE74_16320 [Pseudomonadales bacterium]